MKMCYLAQYMYFKPVSLLFKTRYFKKQDNCVIYIMREMWRVADKTTFPLLKALFVMLTYLVTCQKTNLFGAPFTWLF